MNWINRRRQQVRRRFFARAFGVMWVTVLVAASVGTVLPPAHVVGDAQYFPRTPEAVWRVLTDLDGMPRWRSDLLAVERLPARDGRVVWREIGTKGMRVFEQESAQAPSRLVLRWVGSRGLEPPRRRYELAPTDSGTLVVVTDRRSYANPIARILVRLPLRTPAPVVFLQDLAGRFRPAGEIAASQLP